MRRYFVNRGRKEKHKIPSDEPTTWFLIAPNEFNGRNNIYLAEDNSTRWTEKEATVHLTAHGVNVANMTSYAISSSMILVIHDNMINGTNHIV
jgi:hypothetical protein